MSQVRLVIYMQVSRFVPRPSEMAEVRGKAGRGRVRDSVGVRGVFEQSRTWPQRACVVPHNVSVLYLGLSPDRKAEVREWAVRGPRPRFGIEGGRKAEDRITTGIQTGD